MEQQIHKNKKETEKVEKPVLWDGRRYHSLDSYLKKTFGSKIYKIALNGGMTCPNRDGTVGDRGCIFCSKGGSGDFTPPADYSITAQIEYAKQLVINKVKEKNLSDNPVRGKYIAYFQAFSNTYAPVSYLRKKFTEAILNPNIVALSIGTRPDCFTPPIIRLLAELNNIKPVWVELGLQTIHDTTASLIRRGYPLNIYDETVQLLNKNKIPVIVHVILGLPYETKKMMLETVDYVGKSKVQGIKLQLMHILKGTDLGTIYESKPEFKNSFALTTIEKYVDVVISAIELLPQNMIIHRLTGDGPKNLLIAPDWSANKKVVLNTISKEMARRNTWQGKKYNPN